MLAKYHDSMLKSTDLLDPFRLLDVIYSPTSWTDRTWTRTTSSAWRTTATEKGLELAIDLPGVKSKDISVQVTGREIKVTSKLRGKESADTFRLSKEYDPATIDAYLEDGVLTLSFEKLPEAQPKEIAVKVR